MSHVWALAAIVTCALVSSDAAHAQDRLTAAVFEALKPALPYPSADEHDLPVDGNTTALWIVRWSDAAPPRVEIIANPLNLENQNRANKADEEIQRAVMAAQQRAQAQYERAVAEFEKTGKTDPIDGITLGDEGVAGERFDASIRVVVTVELNQKEYRRRIRSSAEPAVSSTPHAAIVRVPANVFRERPAPAQPEVQRFHASEAHVIFGTAAPGVTRSGPNGFDVVAVPAPSVPSVAISLHGNETLIEQILARANWAAIADALKAN